MDSFGPKKYFKILDRKSEPLNISFETYIFIADFGTDNPTFEFMGVNPLFIFFFVKQTLITSFASIGGISLKYCF